VKGGEEDHQDVSLRLLREDNGLALAGGKHRIDKDERSCEMIRGIKTKRVEESSQSYEETTHDLGDRCLPLGKELPKNTPDIRKKREANSRKGKDLSGEKKRRTRGHCKQKPQVKRSAKTSL